MDRYDPDRPSIFPRRDDADATSMRTSREPEADDTRLRRNLIVLGGMGLAVLALGGFIFGSMMRTSDEPRLAGASASPTIAVTASPSASASVEPTSTPGAATAPPTTAATPPATPAPTPAGPPAELAVGGWATVRVGELNVRRDADLESTSVYRLVRGAVAHVVEGPRMADGYAWYRIASLGGATGWAASGPQSAPFLSTLARGADLVQCGRVAGPVFADGSLDPAEVIRIGDLALPPSAFEPGEIGGFELARGTGLEVCITAVAGDRTPTVYVELSHSGCGHPVVSGDRLEFHPMAGMHVVAENQHRDVVRIHPAVLDPKDMDDAVAANMRAILAWMSNDPRSWGCLMQGVHESPNGERGGIQLDIRGCGVIEALSHDRAVVRAAAGGGITVLALTAGSAVDPSLPIGVPTGMIAWGFDDLNQRSISLAPYPEAPCP